VSNNNEALSSVSIFASVVRQRVSLSNQINSCDIHTYQPNVVLIFTNSNLIALWLNGSFLWVITAHAT
jgi:hypothetical protein